MADYSCPEAYRLLVSCEHGGNLVPASLRDLFAGHEHTLASHLGHDPGALQAAIAMTRCFHAPLYYATVSRLVVDCNRSPANHRVFSRFTRSLDREHRQRLLADFLQPHHAAVMREAARCPGTIVHLAVHTFTPELGGRIRNTDIGLLYDPARSAEQQLCRGWQDEFRRHRTRLRVRRNYPYLGRTDGLPTILRKTLPENRYLGIEVEINQALACGPQTQDVVALLCSTLQRALETFSGNSP